MEIKPIKQKYKQAWAGGKYKIVHNGAVIAFAKDMKTAKHKLQMLKKGLTTRR